MSDVTEIHAEWYEPPVPDPPLWGVERELYLHCQEHWFRTGKLFWQLIKGMAPEGIERTKSGKRVKEFLEDKFIGFTTRWGLIGFINRLAFNVPIGPPADIQGVSKKDARLYEDLTKLRIPVLIDTLGWWSIPTPDWLGAIFGKWGVIISKIPFGWPDWGYSWLIFTQHMTARDWGKFLLIYDWLWPPTEGIGYEPFIQTSRIVCHTADPQDMYAVVRHPLSGVFKIIAGDTYVTPVDPDWEWPDWAWKSPPSWMKK